MMTAKESKVHAMGHAEMDAHTYLVSPWTRGIPTCREILHRKESPWNRTGRRGQKG